MSLWAPREVLTGSPPSVKPRANAWQSLCTHPARRPRSEEGRRNLASKNFPFTKEAVTKGAILIGSSRDFEGASIALESSRQIKRRVSGGKKQCGLAASRETTVVGPRIMAPSSAYLLWPVYH